MSECPHCGAKAVYTSGDFTKFACGFDTGNFGFRVIPCYETEIARLKAKLDAQLNPLEWKERGSGYCANGLVWPFEIDFVSNGIYSLSQAGCFHGTHNLAAAQAHAEDLHQAQGREILSKWFSKESK